MVLLTKLVFNTDEIFDVDKVMIGDDEITTFTYEGPIKIITEYKPELNVVFTGRYGKRQSITISYSDCYKYKVNITLFEFCDYYCAWD